MCPNDPDWKCERRVSAGLVHSLIAVLLDTNRPAPGQPDFWRWFEPVVFAIEAEINEAVLTERGRWLSPSTN